MQFPRDDITKLLYNQGPVQRFTQDSPVLPDVWLAYAENPRGQQDLLLTPHQTPGSVSLTPGELCRHLEQQLSDAAKARAKNFQREPGRPHGLAYNQTTAAVRLYLDELVRIVLPVSGWWQSRVFRAGYADEVQHLGDPQVRRALAELLAGTSAERPEDLGPDVLWMIRVIGTIALLKAAQEKKTKKAQEKAWSEAWPPPNGNSAAKKCVDYFERIVEAVAWLIGGIETEQAGKPLVHLVSRNRSAAVNVWRSSISVKSDAARRLFELSCRDIAWAVIDSGIDARHPAFRQRKKSPVEKNGAAVDELLPLPEQDWSKNTRVIGTYDFTVIRDLLSTNPDNGERLPATTRRRLKKEPKLRRTLRASLNSGREIDWTLIMPLIQVTHGPDYEAPTHEHGTHVAGILAADWRPGEEDDNCPLEQPVQGVCPDIGLYDLRVLDEQGHGDEFNVMAALQFLRYLNSHKDFMVVHGANLSLSIRHEVMNYACGRTPVCDECERLVGSGVTVVAAAGNRGYVPATDLMEEGYRTISITDPGNADGVITVGATHRDSPHTYGVSFFSSRGPTGDGRIKPDLVAPGEKIESCIPERLLKRLDGTSMAAPHVSGAAALLLARHRELIGQPRRIKDILCRTATDLGRERYFQGHGMLDVLRALQFV